jgi:MFS family permease
VNAATPIVSTVAELGAQRRLLAAGMLCYGFDALDFMMLAMAMPLLIAEWHLTLGEAGLLGTAGMIGVGLSGLVLGWYSDRHGRRRALLLSVAVFALFTAAIAFAQSPTQVMVLRFLAGFGIGGVWGAVTALRVLAAGPACRCPASRNPPTSLANPFRTPTIRHRQLCGKPKSSAARLKLVRINDKSQVLCNLVV